MSQGAQDDFGTRPIGRDDVAHWLSDAAPDPESDVRRADVVRSSAVLMTACVVGLALRRLAGEIPASTVALGLVACGLFVFAWVASARGRLPLQVAGGLVVSGLLALVLLVPLLSDGLSTPILFILPVVPILAGRLLGRRGPLWVLAISCLGILLLYLLNPGGGGAPVGGVVLQPPEAQAVLLAIAVLLGAFFGRTSEQRRRARRHQFDASQARYRLLFHRSEDPVMMTTADGRVVDVNAAAVEALGFADRSDALAASVQDFYVEDSSRDELLRELRAKGTVKQRFSRLRHRSGREIVIAGTTVAETGLDGEVETLLTIFRDVTGDHQRQERLIEEARRDPLTGLPNRRRFEERLVEVFERTSRYLEQSAVLLMDLDGFKEINDGHGHPVGDEVLQVVAERLAGIVRKVDTLARLGGDEFAVINTRATVDGVRILAERLIASLEVPIHVAEEDFRISACVGAAFCTPPSSPASTAQPRHDTVVERADRALYRAKARGRGEIEIVPAGAEEDIRDANRSDPARPDPESIDPRRIEPD